MRLPFSPTEELYATLQRIFDTLNGELFGGKLPCVMITLAKHGVCSSGHLSKDRFARNTSNDRADELRLNPQHFSAPVDQVLAIMAHLMVHLWQAHFGNTSRPGYHNREWAAQMRSIGLQPTSSGMPGGRETGQTMSQYVISGSPFDQVTQRLVRSGLEIEWAQLIEQQDPAIQKNKAKRGGRITLRCNSCGQRAWAKPTAQLMCALCNETMLEQDKG